MLGRISFFCGLIVAAIGTVVIIGWAFDLEGLKRVAPSLAAMKANTAIALIASGIALVCLRRGASTRSQVSGRALGLVIALFAALVCAEYLFGDVGIDRLLFSDSGSVHPGRPSPHTAAALILFGATIASTDLAGRWRRLSPVLAVLFGVTVLFATVGYAFGVPSLHSVSNTDGIAVHTLAALLLLTVGLFCLRPERGLTAVLLGDDAGARMARILLPVAILGPLLLGVARFEAQKAGWIGLSVGISVYVLAAVLGLAALVYLTARRLRSADVGLRRLAAIVAASRDPIVSIDRQRRISSWNDAAARLLGYSREEAVGRALADLVPPDRLEELDRNMATVAQGRSVVGWETERLRKDGTRVEVEMTVSPAFDESGRVVGASAILRDNGERKEAERRFRSLLDAAPDAIVIVDQGGKIVLVNQEVERSFGYSRQELLGKSIEFLVPERLWARHAKHRAGFMRDPEARPMGLGLELEAQRRDGSEFPVEISLSPFEGKDGRLIIAAVRDVTERRRAAGALADSQERFRRAFEDSGVGMALVSIEEGRLSQVFEANEAISRISGFTAAQLLEMKPTSMFIPSELPAVVEELQHLLDGSISSARREVRLIAAGGDQVWTSVTASVVRGGADAPATYLIVQVQDITERKRFEGQLQYLADHDALTGLFNRRRFEEELEREVATARRFDAGGAVLVLDLDHFKLVNDSFGHAVGDELIANVGQALRRRLRTGDVLGRMGGDEFAMILPRVTVAEAREVGEALLDVIRQDTLTSSAGGNRRMTASLGIALLGESSASVGAQELLAEADIAMYDAKEAGRDRLVVFDPGSPRHERTEMRLDWIARIEEALAEDRFVLHAQPILSLDGDRATRVELLLRMVGEDGDLIPPGSFLYLAERSDLAQRIDRWVVSRAVELIAEQERLGHDAYFEINLSGSSIGDDEVSDHIAATLTEAGVEPRRLILEVTETAAIVNVGRAKEFARRMHELGCGFALDDFGAGFATFYYLKHLSFDLLKIDGEFIRNLPASRTDQLVVKSVVAIANGLGKKTVAEFVGDQQTIDLLRQYGVDYAQGFFLGMPRPLEQVDFAPSRSKSKAR